jgi:hypothetical protein
MLHSTAFPHGQMVIGIMSCLVTLAMVLGLFGFVGYLMFGKR